MDYKEKYLKYKTKYINLKKNNQSGGGKDINLKDFSKWLDNKFNKCWELPGFSIVIFNDKDILLKKVYGYANVKTKRKLKLSDKFCIASCSKSVLCLAITLAIKKKDIPQYDWN